MKKKKKKNNHKQGNKRKNNRPSIPEQIWMWALVVLCVVGLTVAAVLIFSPDEPHEDHDHSDGDGIEYAADCTVFDSSGKELKLSELRGRPVVVNFWATWCPYCLQEMPEFEAAFQKYGDEVVFLMVNATTTNGETQQKAKAYIEEMGYTFPVYYDLGGSAISAHNVTSYPVTLFLNADGSLNDTKVGMLTAELLEQGIQNIK